MNVQMPDGTIIEGVPEGTPKSEVLKKLQAKGTLDFDKLTYSPTVGMSGTAKFFTGAGAGLNDIWRGAKQTVGLMDQSDIQDAQRLDKPLTDTGLGKAGYITGQMAPAAAAILLPGANTVAGAAAAGGIAGLVQPVAEGNVPLGKIKNAAVGAVTSGGVQAGMQQVGKMIGKSVADNAAAKTANEVKDFNLGTAKDAGYVIPPSQVNPSWTNSLLEGLAGKISTAQKASVKNQQITNDLAKAAVKLNPDEQITKESLQRVRNVAGQAYQELADIKTLGATPEFVQKVRGLGKDYQALIKDVPELADPQIDNLVKALDKPSFSGATAVALIKRLRFDGNKNAYNGNLGPRANELGKAQLEAAGAIEDLIEQNITQTGQAGAETLKNFREARTLIAKTYSVEGALNQSTGNVVAGKLGAQLNKGKPLSGELKTVGQFAQAYPKAAQEVTSSMPGVSPLDYALATGGVMAGKPSALSWLAMRPAARSLILSSPYQAMNQPSYQGVGMTMVDLLRTNPALNSDSVRNAMRMLPAQAATGNR